MNSILVKPIVIGSVVFLGLAASAPPVAPQEQASTAPTDQSFVERVDVRVVNVDVWVTDAQDDPVTGLRVEDFEILHDGESVEVDYFSEVRCGVSVQPTETASGEGPSTKAVAPAAAFPGHVVVYFDQSRLGSSSYQALSRGLEQFLLVDGIDPERVLILSQRQALSVEAPFGSSRRELEQALERLAADRSAGLSQRGEDTQALNAIREAWEASQDTLGSALTGLATAAAAPGPPDASGGSGGGSPRDAVGGPGAGPSAGPDACGPFLGRIQPILDGWTRSQSKRIANTLSNLSDTASFLAGLPGVKTLLYLSDGLDTQPGTALATYATGLCPAAAPELMTGTLAEQMSEAFLELTRRANTRRVTIHALQASGLSGLSVADASSGRQARGARGARGGRRAYDTVARSGEREGMRLIAKETGGRAVFDQNDLGADLIRIGGDVASYYSLAFRKPDAGNGKSHRIEVRLADESLEARYRSGYRDRDEDRWLTERIEGALHLGIIDNPLEMRLGSGVIQPAAEGGLLRLPLHLMVPVEQLAFEPQGDSMFATVTARILARNLDTGALSMRDKNFRVRGAPGATGFADLVVELELAAGNYHTAIGVRDDASRVASFVSTTVPITQAP